MGRRSLHKPDELRKLIVDAAYQIVMEGGPRQLSAREIAREIKYAPGTLYNMYENLDEILLRVELRLIEQLDDELARDMKGATGADAIRRYATTCVAFAHRQPRLWRLFMEHSLPAGVLPPVWYREALEALSVRLERPVAAILRSNDAKTVRQAAHGLWFLVQSLTSLSVNSKLVWTSNDDIAGYVDAIVNACLKELALRGSGRRPNSLDGEDRPGPSPR